MHIVILEALGIRPDTLQALKAPFEAEGHTFAEYSRTSDLPTLIRQAEGADALILSNMPLPAAVLEACPRLQFVDIAFTGVDHVAMDVLRKRGIPASNASGYSNEAVAELAVGMALSLLRHLPQVEARCRQGGTKEGLVGSELKGKTVGILGLGAIGRRSAALFHAFGARILASSRHTHPDCPPYVEEVDLECLLAESDLLVLHCPLTPDTRGLINTQALARMKPSALLLNLARGPVVVAEDLAQALQKGVIAGAALDVFDVEPPLPPTEPLLQAPNCLLTPHIAFATQESMELRAQIVFENLRAWLDGSPIHLVS